MGPNLLQADVPTVALLSVINVLEESCELPYIWYSTIGRCCLIPVIVLHRNTSSDHRLNNIEFVSLPIIFFPYQI